METKETKVRGKNPRFSMSGIDLLMFNAILEVQWPFGTLFSVPANWIPKIIITDVGNFTYNAAIHFIKGKVIESKSSYT